MKKMMTVATVAVVFGTGMTVSMMEAKACSPAPMCWVDGPDAKAVCRNVAKKPGVYLKDVEMPEKVGEYVKACAKVGVHIKLPPKINFTYKPGEFRKMNPD